MSLRATRIMYSIILALALTLGYNLTHALIQDNIKTGSNEYYRMIQCMDKNMPFDSGNCKRIVA